MIVIGGEGPRGPRRPVPTGGVGREVMRWWRCRAPLFFGPDNITRTPAAASAVRSQAFDLRKRGRRNSAARRDFQGSHNRRSGACELGGGSTRTHVAYIPQRRSHRHASATQHPCLIVPSTVAGSSMRNLVRSSVTPGRYHRLQRSDLRLCDPRNSPDPADFSGSRLCRSDGWKLLRPVPMTVNPGRPHRTRHRKVGPTRREHPQLHTSRVDRHDDRRQAPPGAVTPADVVHNSRCRWLIHDRSRHVCAGQRGCPGRCDSGDFQPSRLCRSEACEPGASVPHPSATGWPHGARQGAVPLAETIRNTTTNTRVEGT